MIRSPISAEERLQNRVEALEKKAAWLSLLAEIHVNTLRYDYDRVTKLAERVDEHDRLLEDHADCIDDHADYIEALEKACRAAFDERDDAIAGLTRTIRYRI